RYFAMRPRAGIKPAASWVNLEEPPFLLGGQAGVGSLRVLMELPKRCQFVWICPRSTNIIIGSPSRKEVIRK
ncbi:MAG TPA: hypothetical protein VH598_01980, partial [Verrucomicrobiae bacterium]|nr:hypothetical protein [Verrucomicrobiae bacterium]